MTRLPAPSIAVAALALLACATTEPTGRVEPSGFLGDYSQLGRGGPDQAALVFIDADADFSGYERAIVDPVTIWRAGEGMQDLPEEEARRLEAYLDAAIREKLGQAFELVEDPGPGTLRIRAAITEAVGSNTMLDVATTVLPPARLLSEVKKLATGTHAFVGRAAIEVEILDSDSGARLAAAADERAGGKALRGSSDTWSDVRDAFDHWASVLAARLSMLRGIDAAAPRWDAEAGG